MKFILFFSLFLFGVSSCIEIIDDIAINEDGSGTFKYSINLSSSKVKINSALALDSLDGKKIPSIEEISEIADRLISLLKTQEGISNVNFSSNYTDFVFRLECDFSSIDRLQEAIRTLILSESKQKDIPELDTPWITYHDNKLVRSIPTITIKKAAEINRPDIDLLKGGKYTSITRFQKDVTKMKNAAGIISKNKKAVMVWATPYSLIQNPQLLDNTIFLVKTGL